MSEPAEDEIARLMAMSDEEIIAEARAEGIDTDKLAHEMAQQFQVIAKLVRERDKAREEVTRLRAALRSIEGEASDGECICQYCAGTWEIVRRALEEPRDD